MNTWLIYIAKVSAVVMLLQGFYILFLHRDTNFRFNRAWLMLSALIALLIPAFRFSIPGGGETVVFSGIFRTVQVIPDVAKASTYSFGIPVILLGIYLTGVAVLLIRFSVGLIKLIRLRSTCRIIEKNGLRIAVCQEAIQAFSFINTIFLSQETLHSTQFEKIVLHESIHVKQKHSLDVLFMEIFTIFNWFNPFTWIIRSALKETHEYLADAGVRERSPDDAGYMMLLLRNSIGVHTGLANHFNHSLILKRIKMMRKPRSGRLSVLKALPVFPLLVLLFLAFSCHSNTNEKLSQQKDTEQIMPGDSVEKMPSFPGGQEAMSKFIVEQVKYPQEAKEKGIQGTVYVQFTVTKSGKLDKIAVKKAVNPLLDAEALRVIKLMPDWIPGETKGKVVAVEITLPISFKLS